MAADQTPSSVPPQSTSFAKASFDRVAISQTDTLKSERESFRQAEIGYKKKILALEEEAESLLKSYQGIYNDNKILRSKLQHGPDATKIKSFRNEIKRLEESLTELRKDNEKQKSETKSIEKELKKSKDENKKLEESLQNEKKMQENSSAAVVKETKVLQSKVNDLEKKCEEYEFRIKNYEQESDGLLGRYKELKHENLKMESKYRQQRGLIDEEVKDTKETSKEMAIEVMRLKAKLGKLDTEYHSLKLDYEASQKQLDYQSKELDVYKTQASFLKKNESFATQENKSMREKIKSYEIMLEDERMIGLETIAFERHELKEMERKLQMRIEDLEQQREDVLRQNEALKRDVIEYRKRMDMTLSENQALVYANTNLKKRVEMLEHANNELDRKSKFAIEQNKKSLIVTMNNDENLSQKERSSLWGKIYFLESQNIYLNKRLKDLGVNTRDVHEKSMVYSFRNSPTKGLKGDRVIDLPALIEETRRGRGRRLTLQSGSKSFPSSRES